MKTLVGTNLTLTAVKFSIGLYTGLIKRALCTLWLKSLSWSRSNIWIASISEMDRVKIISVTQGELYYWPPTLKVWCHQLKLFVYLMLFPFASDQWQYQQIDLQPLIYWILSSFENRFVPCLTVLKITPETCPRDCWFFWSMRIKLTHQFTKRKFYNRS